MDTSSAGLLIARLRRLSSITSELACADNLADVGRIILTEAKTALTGDIGAVAILSSDKRTLRNIGFEGVDDKVKQAWQEYPIDSAVPLAESVRCRELIVARSREERDRRWPVMAAAHGLHQGGAVVACPLMCGSTLYGGLAFCFSGPRVFDEDELSFIHTVAQQCAIAIERIHLGIIAKQESEERARSESGLALLVEASGQLVGTTDLDSFLPATLELARKLITADAYAVWLHVSGTENWRIAASHGLSTEYQQLTLESISGTEPELDKPLLIEDADAAPFLQRHREPRIREGIRSLLVIPLRIDKQNAGTLVFYYRTLRKFADADVRIGTGAGNLIASCLTNIRAFERESVLRREAESAKKESEQANQRATFIAQLNSTLVRSLDLSETLNLLVQQIVPSFADCCGVHLCTDTGKSKVMAMHHRDPARQNMLRQFAEKYQPEDNPDSLIKTVLSTGAPVLIEEARSLPPKPSAPGSPITSEVLQALDVQSIMLVAMVARNAPIGVISFISSNPERRYSKADLRFAEEIATHAAWMVDNSRLYSEVIAADKRKDQFLATLGHELRNPLGPVRTGIRVLSDPAADKSETARTIEIMQRQITHMTRLIDDLLDAARVKSGRINFEMKSINLSNVVVGICKDHEASLHAADLTLHKDIGGEEVWVNADAIRLGQAIGNLLHNASKFTEPGGEVTVAMRRSRSNVEITVSDTGIGIPAEIVPRIFEAFAHNHEHSTGKGGLGLGLALVKGLVEGQGGTVTAASILGRGSEFRISLPIIAPPAKSQATTRLKPEVTGVVRKILIIDDNADIVETLSMMLRLSGHNVRVAHSGEEGLAEAARFEPALILCDVGMPDMDGYTVARRLRAKQCKMRLIAITGYGRTEDQQRALEAGFDKHLAKPVDPDLLFAIVNSIFEAGKDGDSCSA